MRKILALNLISLSFLFLLSCDEEKPTSNFEADYSLTNDFTGIADIDFENLKLYPISNKVLGENHQGGSQFTPLILSSSVYLTDASGRLAKYSQSELDWVVKPEGSAYSSSKSIADNTGNLYYTVDGKSLISYSPKGDLRWQTNLFESDNKSLGLTYISIAILGSSELVIITAESGVLAVVDASNGDKITSFDLNAIAASHSQVETEGITLLAVPKTKNRFGATDTLKIFELNGNGLSLMIDIPTEKMRITRNPIATESGVFITGTVDVSDQRMGLIRKYSYDGQVIWEKQILNMPRGLSYAEGNLYIHSYSFGLGSSLNSITVLDSTGKTIWNRSYKLDILSEMIVTDKYLLMHASDGEAYGVYRILKENGDIRDYVSVSDKASLHYEFTIGPAGEILMARADSLSYGYIF
ncbi:MAG: hypothetical protein Kapaf2KO_02550 [Candidatus Kapaibacteriales bacterium]